MSKNYIVEISESNGKLAVERVERIVQVNQYAARSETLAKSTFEFSDIGDRATLKKATRKTSPRR